MHDSTFKINSSFVSERINKIRFIGGESGNEDRDFVSGGSGDVKLWNLVKNEFSESHEFDYVPKAISKVTVQGEVTGLEVIDSNSIVCSSGSSVTCIYRDLDRNDIRENFRFGGLHKFKNNETALCTGLSVFEDSVSTIGEDGRITILSLVNQKIYIELENADSVTQTAVNFINYKEMLTGNRLGIIKSYDLRTGLKEPSGIFPISCEDEKKSNAVTCIANHPTQQHIILSGSEEGTITVYDVRQPNFPASYLSAHDFAITELKFHPTQPDKLFTASANGELFKWTQNMMQAIPQEYDNKSPIETINPWLNGERAKKNVQITTLLSGLRKSITAIDCSRQSRVLCSCNNEAVYVIENVF